MVFTSRCAGGANFFVPCEPISTSPATLTVLRDNQLKHFPAGGLRMGINCNITIL